MTGQFAGKTVMITGAGGAIASGIIQKFAAEGANLVLVDRSASETSICERLVGNQPVKCLGVVADLNNPDDVDNAVKQVEATFDTIDVLIHTAGGFGSGAPVHETDVSLFDRMMMLNARILFITLGRVAKHMVEKNVQGNIVTILARPALKGAKNMAAYSASKAAAQRIVESMAIELRDHQIRVNGVIPSTADTRANRESMPNADFEKWVTLQQLADTIAFLASDAASAISGESIGVYNRA